MNKLMNKKAAGTFLGMKVINWVIAIIVIVLLFFAVKGLASVINDSSKLNIAEGALNNFLIELDSFVKSNENEKVFGILGPKDWYINFYEKRYSPTKCNRVDSCVCFCLTKDLKECSGEYSACSRTDLGIYLGDGDFKINKIPFAIKITKTGKSGNSTKAVLSIVK